MSADIASMKQSLVRLRQERAELETIRKEAFMAAPPMPKRNQANKKTGRAATSGLDSAT